MKKKFDITAIIYDRRGRVLSIGKNSYIKTHPMQAKYAKKYGDEQKQFLHAEIAALIKCSKLEKAHSIEIFRHNKDGTPGNAKPCCICAGALSKTNIKIIKYTMA